VFVILKEFQDPTRNGDRRAAIEEVLKRRINCAEMAKRSLGTSWMDLDESQRTTYVALFVELLRDSLANRMSEYSGERIEYLSERWEGEFAEVRTRLIGAKVDAAIDFRLTNRSGTWLVYDAVMDGASLVSNYHAQFSRVIGETSVERLVDKMKEKAVVVKLFEKHP
jgi:phospholipid transport system substrate-binding protein